MVHEVLVVPVPLRNSSQPHVADEEIPGHTFSLTENKACYNKGYFTEDHSNNFICIIKYQLYNIKKYFCTNT
jgi:hypothetical protein